MPSAQPHGLDDAEATEPGPDPQAAASRRDSGPKPLKSDRGHPVITSLHDLTTIEAWDQESNLPKYVTFYHVTPDEELYFGESTKNKKDITIEEYAMALQRVHDEEIYPEVPTDVCLTLAPEALDERSAYIKRPGLTSYESVRGTDFVPRALLDETLIMEKISKSPHPNIVGYYGCRVRRSRITAIVLERLDKSLTQYSLTAEFQTLNRNLFVEELESAVDFLHSMGLAHNDINPDNIMVKNETPVLIDFGSCQPFGKPLQSLGTEGWYEDIFFTSEKKHDVYSLGKLREWLETHWQMNEE